MRGSFERRVESSVDDKIIKSFPGLAMTILRVLRVFGGAVVLSFCDVKFDCAMAKGMTMRRQCFSCGAKKYGNTLNDPENAFSVLKELNLQI